MDIGLDDRGSNPGQIRKLGYISKSSLCHRQTSVRELYGYDGPPAAWCQDSCKRCYLGLKQAILVLLR